MAVEMHIQHNLEMTWFRIAVEHERAALEARARLDAALASSEDIGQPIDDEMRSSIVTIAAAAFAIDAMFVKVEDLLDVSERLRIDGRVDRIVETFKAALRLDRRTQRWQAAITRLFKLRRDGPLPRGGDARTASPDRRRERLARAGTYTAEEASGSVDLALEVLTVAHRSPRRRHAALVEWAERDAHIPAYLEAVRRGEAT